MKVFNNQNNGNVKKVAGNFMYLSVLNALNIILPLITLPYLMHTVGKGNYGIYSYVYMILQYVITFSTYGFNFSATKQISQCRDDREKVNVIYNSVIISKIMIGTDVQIHPFPNGNGRLSRLMADLVLNELEGTKLYWGDANLATVSEIRLKYIESLRKADAGDYNDLLNFTRNEKI